MYIWWYFIQTVAIRVQFNSTRSSDTYMPDQTRPSWISMMAWHVWCQVTTETSAGSLLNGAPGSKCRWIFRQKNYTSKRIWKYRLQNGRHFSWFQCVKCLTCCPPLLPPDLCRDLESHLIPWHLSLASPPGQSQCCNNKKMMVNSGWK